MTSATVSKLRYDFPGILKHLEDGEEVAISRRGKIIAKLVPAEPIENRLVHWPDLLQRLRVAHGNRNLRPVTSVVRQRRKERR